MIEPENNNTKEPAWKRVLKRMENVPDEVFDRIPVDGSVEVDHYIYGTQRKFDRQEEL